MPLSLSPFSCPPRWVTFYFYLMASAWPLLSEHLCITTSPPQLLMTLSTMDSSTWTHHHLHKNYIVFIYSFPFRREKFRKETEEIWLFLYSCCSFQGQYFFCINEDGCFIRCYPNGACGKRKTLEHTCAFHSRGISFLKELFSWRVK